MRLYSFISTPLLRRMFLFRNVLHLVPEFIVKFPWSWIFSCKPFAFYIRIFLFFFCVELKFFAGYIVSLSLRNFPTVLVCKTVKILLCFWIFYKSDLTCWMFQDTIWQVPYFRQIRASENNRKLILDILCRPILIFQTYFFC